MRPRFTHRSYHKHLHYINIYCAISIYTQLAYNPHWHVVLVIGYAQGYSWQQQANGEVLDMRRSTKCVN